MHALAYAKGEIEGSRGAAVVLGLRPSTLRSRMKKLGITRAAALLAGLPSALPTDWDIKAVQRRHISEVLVATGGRIEGPGGAADRLALQPSTLRTRIAKLKIERSVAPSR
jgi:transcriptional regulator with GAF, ATPase, and Fis domain